MYAEIFKVIVPAGFHPTLAAVSSEFDEHDKIQAFQGSQVTKNIGITAEGSGSSVQGHIAGSVQTYDYKALYTVYGLDNNVSADYWFVHYQKDTHQDVLQKTFESSQTTTVNYDLNFQLQGNNYGITAVYVTYQVIRLKINGVTKDFVVTNNASSGAVDPSGAPYLGFKPVPAQ